MKVLIANRGEIAVRVIRTCKELGFKTVAVYSEADKDSLHRKLADEDICIGGPYSKDSYLNIPSLISAATILGANAIHPGYGFLSENAKFSEICKNHGITFLGPSPEVISLMGDKSTAKNTMKKFNVPTVPGSEGVISNVDEALEVARSIGYPVIIKATAGGGGKGMRICYSADDLKKLLPLTQAEAQAAFGNPGVYIEKYVQNPKHIEIQFIGDKYGNAVSFGERDCSIQRKHQKLIEEAPGPTITEEQRQKISSIVTHAVSSIGYVGAGTMEFIMDQDGNFYFMEVNTRIQVEHPVTEEVTGYDLIREQMLVCLGEKLSVKQEDIKMNGHAMEFRINAEDPFNEFRPSPGQIKVLHLPGGYGVRVDTHIYQGYEIPMYYDSMVAKLIVWGKNRNEVINRAKRALSEFTIEGIPTTIPFHSKVLEHPVFLSGTHTTRFLENFSM
ncbi:MAG: acetyl-CoA carboxylase biotin carboxylase subunit [Spirochaetia bacterium]|nr:acetyl-CoA carboxylase biotin carboxylase subunit [Spirochaetota bacterium]MCX8096058.1 acetyl-CoA carboxylase biotin carboxylase subunit [Spirochaetota bacterium]MDW8113236.1 acetyl-CoA carboxylase biotin carboxylase subunit [Spirochaetia bacterium]